MVPRARKKVFAKFYDRYVDKVYRFIFLKVDSVEASQDLTAEVFLRFWKQLDSPTEIDNPRAYVYSIARHLVIDYYRKTRPVSLATEEIEVQDTNVNLEKEGVLGSDLKGLKLALQKLPDEYQNVIIWYYLDEFPVVQIAAMTNKTENATRVTIHRALNALRDQMNNPPRNTFLQN